MSRPPLPVRYANPHLSTMTKAAVPQVKYQILNCQGSDILVGRMKVLTPGDGHAFILRRYDTGAVSLTTMFRAAYPSAPEEAEKKEIQWVKENHNLAGNNGSSAEPHITRLAGTWVDPDLAEDLSVDYRLSDVISVVVASEPDPTQNYRRSSRSTQPVPASQLVSNGAATTQATVAESRASKRRRPSTPPQDVSPVERPPSTRRTSKPPSQPSRRSTRAKSPSVKASASMTSIVSPVKTPRKETTRRKQPVTPAGSDETAVDEPEGAIDVASAELHKQDVEEQKHLIAGLKAQRAAASQASIAEEDEPEEEQKAPKRAREDEEMKFNFEKQPEPETENRLIATNRRVGMFQMEPQRKSAAWGVAAFVFGASVMAFAPNFL